MAHKSSTGSSSSDHAGSNNRSAAKGTHGTEWFSRFAHETARLAGKPVAFILAVVVIVVWAASGPLFNYSDTWQLVIITSTTIVTYLMVFLIQNTQNRDTLAIQVKLAELIIALRGAQNRLAIAEDMTEEDLERLHEEYRTRAEATLEHLESRRARARKQRNPG